MVNFLENKFCIKDLQNTEYNDEIVETCLNLCVLSYEDSLTQTLELSKKSFEKIITINKDETSAFMCFKDDIIYIVIRGTNVFDVSDICSNFSVGKEKECSGFVHAGYKKHADKISDAIRIYSTIPHKNIIITGHSLGGGVGQILCYRFKSTGIFFGSVRSISKQLLDTIQSNIYHFQNQYDIIPNFPPKIFFGFRLAGKKFIVKRNDIIERHQKISEISTCIFCFILFTVPRQESPDTLALG